jgi:hypothetical protein
LLSLSEPCRLFSFLIVAAESTSLEEIAETINAGNWLDHMWRKTCESDAPRTHSAASDKSKLMALVQSSDSSDDDDDEQGAPAPNSYEAHSGGIVDVLNGMKEKAEGELKELRKAESNNAQNFNMLKGSLEGQIGADTKDMEEEKSAKAANEEQKATDSGDLAMTEKDLAEAQASLAKISHDCLQTAADHEAKNILQETSSGAVSQSYDFLQMNSQMRTSTDLVKSEVLTAVKGLARRSHSAALAQLASKMSVIMQYGGSNQAHVFAKIKGLVQDMIAKLEKEAEEDAAEKAYCDEELAKTEAKKQELDDEIAKLTSKIDKAAAKSTRLKGEVKEAQATLAALAKTTAEMNKLRQEKNADYKQAKADLELGLGGVPKALEVLREYYVGAAGMIQSDSSFCAFMQQPAKPAKHENSSGAGGSIIGILEVCAFRTSCDEGNHDLSDCLSATGLFWRWLSRKASPCSLFFHVQSLPRAQHFLFFLEHHCFASMMSTFQNVI